MDSKSTVSMIMGLIGLFIGTTISKYLGLNAIYTILFGSFGAGLFGGVSVLLHKWSNGIVNMIDNLLWFIGYCFLGLFAGVFVSMSIENQVANVLISIVVMLLIALPLTYRRIKKKNKITTKDG